MNEARKEKYCKGEGGFIFLLLFAEKKAEVHGYIDRETASV